MQRALCRFQTLVESRGPVTRRWQLNRPSYAPNIKDRTAYAWAPALGHGAQQLLGRSLAGHAQALAAQSSGREAGPAAGDRSVLFLSSVWPERSSSAAGVRTSDLLDAFVQCGWHAAYASSSAPNEHTLALQAAGVQVHQCEPNRERQLADILSAVRPAAVVFDRFYCEEAFSFRVRELAPEAVRIVDMQDFHALRLARQQLAEAGQPLPDVLACRPDAADANCLRELAAIHRSDLALVCSPVELHMLRQHYGIPASKLVLAPFFTPPSPYSALGAATEGGSQDAAPGFSERQHFLAIGNWRHPPNLDAARWACSEIWPAVKAALPPEHRGAQLHLYGSYATGAAQQLHRPKDGVHMLGFAPSLDIMLQYRVLLAPLRYGAGLKGKVIDSWWHGLPVLTTCIGAEGMTAADGGCEEEAAIKVATSVAQQQDTAAEGFVWQMGGQGSDAAACTSDEEWGGLKGGTAAAQVAAGAALLYSNEELWHACQRRGYELLPLLYDRERNLRRVMRAVEETCSQLEHRRKTDFTGSMLWQQQLRSTEYFSRWIEAKNSQKQDSGTSS